MIIIIIIRMIIISSFRQEVLLLSGRHVGIAIYKCKVLLRPIAAVEMLIGCPLFMLSHARETPA